MNYFNEDDYYAEKACGEEAFYSISKKDEPLRISPINQELRMYCIKNDDISANLVESSNICM
jgi:hypothetical protein